MKAQAVALFYACCSSLARLMFRIFCRVHIVMLEQPPQQGPLIMASNHISHFDPALLSAFFPRRLDWVAMEELFRHPWSARFFSWLNAISVDRFGKDPVNNRRSLHTILKRLTQGHAVGIFPEGGIRSGPTSILERAVMKPGTATLSVLSQAPIIPCVVLGADRLYCRKQWFQRPQLFIIIGKKIIPPLNIRSHREEMLADFQEQLSAIFPELQQELCQRFQLCSEDLPKTAQQRLKTT